MWTSFSWLAPVSLKYVHLKRVLPGADGNPVHDRAIVA
jgi:hypothetical protein